MSMRSRAVSTFPDAEGTILCTSTTHPLNPYIGMRIFETDTGKQLTWVGPNNGFCLDWGVAWGLVVRGNGVTISTSHAVITEVLAVVSATFTPVLNRKYRMTYTAVIANQAAAANNYTIRIKDGTTLIDGSGLANLPASGVERHMLQAEASGLTAVSHTINVSGQVSNTGWTDRGDLYISRLTVDDIGPNGNPT